MPYMSASDVGGHPGTYISTGTIPTNDVHSTIVLLGVEEDLKHSRSTPRTTE